MPKFIFILLAALAISGCTQQQLQAFGQWGTEYQRQEAANRPVRTSCTKTLLGMDCTTR